MKYKIIKDAEEIYPYYILDEDLSGVEIPDEIIRKEKESQKKLWECQLFFEKLYLEHFNEGYTNEDGN